MTPLGTGESNVSATGDDQAARRRLRFRLAYPPDLPADDPCPGYPTACVQPFHYDNPVSGRRNEP